MILIGLWLILSIIGLVLVFIGSAMGNITGSMIGITGGFMLFFPVLQTSGIVKRFKLIPFFMTLKDHEQMNIMVDNRFRILPMIFNTKNEGMLQKKDVGLIEDKGTLCMWGDIPCSISLPRCGVAVDLKMSQYNSILTKNRELRDYDDAIRAYLGPANYTIFYNTFRRDPKPDIYAIYKEIQYLLDQDPVDPLAEKVLGETIDFKSFLHYLKYAYHPQSAQNAMDSEVLMTKQMERGYKQVDKIGSLGKTIVMIIIALGILMVILSTIDIGAIF